MQKAFSAVSEFNIAQFYPLGLEVLFLFQNFRELNRVFIDPSVVLFELFFDVINVSKRGSLLLIVNLHKGY